MKVDRILTKETAGIPLSVLIGRKFGINVSIARNKKEMTIRGFFEAKRVYSPGTYDHIYLPRHPNRL